MSDDEYSPGQATRMAVMMSMSVLYQKHRPLGTSFQGQPGGPGETAVLKVALDRGRDDELKLFIHIREEDGFVFYSHGGRATPPLAYRQFLSGEYEKEILKTMLVKRGEPDYGPGHL